jgi:hypothetical protein
MQQHQKIFCSGECEDRGLTGVGGAADVPDLAVDVGALGVHRVHHLPPRLHLLVRVNPRRVHEPAVAPMHTRNPNQLAREGSLVVVS